MDSAPHSFHSVDAAAAVKHYRNMLVCDALANGVAVTASTMTELDDCLSSDASAAKVLARLRASEDAARKFHHFRFLRRFAYLSRVPELRINNSFCGYTVFDVSEDGSAWDHSVFMKFPIDDDADSILMDNVNGILVNAIVAKPGNGYVRAHVMRWIDGFPTLVRHDDGRGGKTSKNWDVLRCFPAAEAANCRMVDTCVSMAVEGHSVHDELARDDPSRLGNVVHALDAFFASWTRLAGDFGIMHNDMHLGNLLYDEKTKTVVLIDYANVTFDLGRVVAAVPGVVESVTRQIAVQRGGSAAAAFDYEKLLTAERVATNNWVNAYTDLDAIALRAASSPEILRWWCLFDAGTVSMLLHKKYPSSASRRLLFYGGGDTLWINADAPASVLDAPASVLDAAVPRTPLFAGLVWYWLFLRSVTAGHGVRKRWGAVEYLVVSIYSVETANVDQACHVSNAKRHRAKFAAFARDLSASWTTVSAFLGACFADQRRSQAGGSPCGCSAPPLLSARGKAALLDTLVGRRSTS